ncbi:hypothetical protein [Paraburkholderia strydomiana]|uniref:hypothetical protein n=1 Tax=Paraburkholderia strydomiana TaxID=1245417 RepID=UPI0038BB5375
MAEKSDLVVAYLTKLSKHKELIALAYHHGSVDASDARDGGRGIFELNQARVLVPYKEGTYRLASSLSKHLDEVLQVERLYSVAGANVSELAQRLPDIANLVANAMFDGRIDDADRYIDEFDRAVFELADSVTGALQSLRIQADNKFANVSSYAEKRRQNEFYLDRVERISQALSAIQSGDMIQSLESTPEGERLLESYHSQIGDHLAEWRAQLLDITAILRDYLFRTRQIELVAQRMRSFELFLRRTPSYVPVDIHDTLDGPAWTRRAAGFSMTAHASVDNAVHEETLLDIARSIPALKSPSVNAARAGSLLPDSPVDSDGNGTAPQPWEEAVASMLEHVSAAPLSALEWKGRYVDVATLDDDIWLLCLLHEEEKGLERHAALRFEHIAGQAERLSGVISLKDIVVSRTVSA